MRLFSSAFYFDPDFGLRLGEDRSVRGLNKEVIFESRSRTELQWKMDKTSRQENHVEKLISIFFVDPVLQTEIYAAKLI